MPESALTIDQVATWWRETGEAELRQVLLWKWDPIDVQESFPATAGEYDDYAADIREAAANGTGALITRLREIETTSMGLDQRRDEELRTVASAIQGWLETSTTTWLRARPPGA